MTVDAAVGNLLIHTLAGLDSADDEGWERQVDTLIANLESLSVDVRPTLHAVITATTALQQLLLEVAVKPLPHRPSRTDIVTVAAAMLAEPTSGQLAHAGR